jgi:hypothetical protein
MRTPSGPVVVGFPLRGEWVPVRTPAHKIPSHATDLFGQRYAFDFVRPDHRKGLHLQPAGSLRSFLLGGRTRDYYGWGQPVHAAFAGQVVAAVDGVPERAWVQVLREVALAVRNTVGSMAVLHLVKGDGQPQGHRLLHRQFRNALDGGSGRTRARR